MSDQRIGAIRQIKWLANSMKDLLALAETLTEPADIQREVDALKAELADLKQQRACYTNLDADIAAKRAELASVTADVDRVRAMFKTA